MFVTIAISYGHLHTSRFWFTVGEVLDVDEERVDLLFWKFCCQGNRECPIRLHFFQKHGVVGSMEIWQHFRYFKTDISWFFESIVC